MWARVDDGWWCHPKVMGLGLAARGLWVSSLSWSCHQRKPVVPWTLLALLGADEGHAAELVAAGLWTAAGDGWEIHDWSEYQELSVSEKRAIAGAKGGKRSGESRRSKAKQTDPLTSTDAVVAGSNGEANAEAGTHPFPSLPNPSISTPVEVASSGRAHPGFAGPKPVAAIADLRSGLRAVDGTDADRGAAGASVAGSGGVA